MAQATTRTGLSDDRRAKQRRRGHDLRDGSLHNNRPIRLPFRLSTARGALTGASLACAVSRGFQELFGGGPGSSTEKVLATKKSVYSDVRRFMVEKPSLDKNEFLKKEGPKKMTTDFLAQNWGF